MAFSQKVAEAHCDMIINDTQWNAGLARAEASLKRFASNSKTFLSALNFNAAITGVNGLNGAFSRLHSTVRSTELAVRALARAIGSMPAMPRGMGAWSPGSTWKGALSGLGAGIGSLLDGLGRGLGSAAKGFGSGLGSAIRGTAPHIGQIGTALSRIQAGFGRAMNQIMRGLSSVISASGRALSSLNPLKMLGGGGGMGGGIGGLLGLAGGGLTAKYVADQAMDMESAMARLQRVTGLEGDALHRLGNELKYMASITPGTSIEDVLGVATMGAKLGIAGGELRLFTSDMIKFSVVLEDMPLAEATTQIARLLAVFGRGSDEAIRFASSLIRLDNASTASAREILDITQRLSGQASFLGMTPQKTMALAAALRESGVPIETAGTAMQQLMVRMASKRDAPKYAKLAGVTTKQFQGKLVGNPLEAITDVLKGLGKMEKIEAEQYLDELSLDGQRVRGTFLQLLQVLPKLSGFVKASEEDWASLSSVQKGFNVQADTTRNQLKLMRTNIDLMAASVGAGLLPVLRGVSQGMVIMTGHVRDFFDRNREAIDGAAKKVGRFFAILGTAPKTLPLVLDWFGAAAHEKLQQFLHVMKFGLGAMGSFLADILDQAATSFGASIKNAMIDVATTFTPILPLLDTLTGGAMKAMGFDFNKFHQDLLNQKKPVPKIAPNMAVFDPLGMIASMPRDPKVKAKLDKLIQVGGDALKQQPLRLAGQGIRDRIQRGIAEFGRMQPAPAAMPRGPKRGTKEFRVAQTKARIAKVASEREARKADRQKERDAKAKKIFMRNAGRAAAQVQAGAQALRVPKWMAKGLKDKAMKMIGGFGQAVPVMPQPAVDPKAAKEAAAENSIMMRDANRPIVVVLEKILASSERPKVPIWGGGMA